MKIPFLESNPTRKPRSHRSFPRSASLWGAASLLLLWGCKQEFPVAETHPVKLPVVCLPPAAPMATLHSPAAPAAPAQADATQADATQASAPFPSAQCVERAKTLTAGLSRAEKFGQMMQPDRGAVRDNKSLAQFGIGSLLSGGGSAPLQNTAMGWARMVNEYREHSLQARHQLPLIYGVDAVHGHNNVRGAVIFPHNIGLGATRDPDLVERIGRITAAEVRATNIDWTFAPVLAAARDERWGRTYEAFGEHQELAELLGPALIRGLQGPRLSNDPNTVLACAKHYVGDGHTENGKDQGDSKLTQTEIEEHLLPAYRAAIEAGVGSMMVSFSSIEGIKMHCHGPLLNDTLKGKLGFNGFLVSDWQAVEKLPGPYAAQLAHAINAGVDMVMAPQAHTGFITTLDSIVPDRVPMERIDDAVARILAVKCELGLLDSDRFRRDRSGGLPLDAELLGKFGSPEHRAVAREAVSKSLVLLKNEKNLLPLDPATTHVHLAGSTADDMGRQCGGWTISWQGEKGPITDGTTVRQALGQALVDPARLVVSADGKAAAQANVGIAVIGEAPYAEYSGDRTDLSLDAEDVQTVKNLKAAGLPVIVVLVSGRPMILGEVLDLADAVVAAWLPGSEGDGVADALFGKVGFSGKLPHSWPRAMADIPINVGDKDYDPLFPYGFGLTTVPRGAAAVAP